MSQDPSSRPTAPHRAVSPNGVARTSTSYDDTVNGSDILVVAPMISIVGRVAGAGLLGAMAWIHWHLYNIGFSSIPTIGPAFKANAVLGVIAAVAVLVTPRRWLAITAAGAAILDAGTLAALAISLTVGLAGFHESTDAPLLPATVIVEVFGIIELAWLAYAHRAPLLEVLRRVRLGHSRS